MDSIKETNEVAGVGVVVGVDVDLFGENLPSMEKIASWAEYVMSDSSLIRQFSERVEEYISNSLAAGIGLFILEKYGQAIETLSKAKDCKEKFLYMGQALCKTGDFAEAVKAFQKSLKFGADSLDVDLKIVSAYRHAKDYEAAEKLLDKCRNFKNVNAEYHYQLGRFQESVGQYSQALDNFKKALELAPNNKKILFHLAYRCDLSGFEDEAVDYYKQITKTPPVHINALLNLAVLYEDVDEFDKASDCIEMVLEHHPNHQRALLFDKDIESSKTMFHDEEKEQRRSRKNQILETPISDFELSVRSRNCLRKMHIYTLGDLLNITESELLSYKNFGETSLKEIKVILESKNLSLGAMSIEASEAEDEDDYEMSDENGLLTKSIDELRLSVRARKCLQKLNLHSLGELTRKTEAELLGCKNFGVTSLNEIKKALGQLGLSLRTLD
jgi:DNA-directed RNA polymerase subunit alpha